MTYPFAPLAAMARVRFRPDDVEANAQATDVTRVDQLLGYRWHRSTIKKWQRDGIPERSADHIACELGLHIDIIWPERRAA